LPSITDKISNQINYNHFENNDIFFNLIELDSNPILIIDKKNKIVYMNKSALNLTGRSDKETLNRDLSNISFLKKDDINNIKKGIKSLTNKKSQIKIMVKYRKNDRAYGDAEVHLNLININNVIFGYKISLRDISEIRDYYDQLEKSEKRWRSLIEMAPDGVVTMNVIGQITSVNDTFLRLTGFTEGEIVGKHFTKIGTIRTLDIPKYIKIFASVLRGKISGPFDMIFKKKDGSSGYGEIHIKLVNIGGKEREILVIARDITQRRKNEEALLKSLKELEISNQELDDYTYAVSHDLKAPLRTIKSFSSFLLEDHANILDEEGKEYLNRMMEATIRMNELIDDLLLISRVSRKHTETEFVDLNKLIEEIKRDFEDQLKEVSGTIVSEDLPTIHVQKVWVKQLFSNLISNGLKFNKSAEPIVSISYEERPTEYLFVFKDNGIGIDEKYHEQIFKIFQRLHSEDEYPGTGAGLTICKKIVDSYGGRIRVESKPGKGSTFYFTYPKQYNNGEESEDYQIDNDLTHEQVELQLHEG